MLKFDAPKEHASIIKVIGVGGGGSNAVTNMFNQGIKGVDFIICNTDNQALDRSPIPSKIQLGDRGLGAGSIPQVGKNAAMENIEELKSLLEHNTKMLFITAGMGGGTGTGAAPVIAKVARELDILTVGIVTIPFSFEGRKRRQQAEEGIHELKEHVDTLLIISNDKLRDLYGNLKLSEAFQKADNILTTAARGIAEIITVTGYINVDFEDVKTVMKDSGKAIMGSAIAEGEDRALQAAEAVLSSPLLNDNNIDGASNILLYIASGGEEISMDEVSEITDYIQQKSGQKADIIWGTGIDEQLNNSISLTLIATGFDHPQNFPAAKKPENTVVHTLEEQPKKSEAVTSNESLKNEIRLVNKSESVADPLFQSDTKKVIFSLDDHVQLETTPETPVVDQEMDGPVLKSHDEENNLFSTQSNAPIEEPVEHPLSSPEAEDIKQRSNERINRLRKLSVGYRDSEMLEEMENVPAYRRREVKLSEGTPSTDTVVSRFTLSIDEGEEPEITTNNSFLHDNVD